MKTLLRWAVAITAIGGCGLEGNPLWLMMTVDKTVVAMDDSVRVSLAISNTSDRGVTTNAESDYGPCLPGFDVTDEEGRQVHMHVICTTDLRPKITLAPGESFQVTTWWYPGISGVVNTPITPGRYTLRGAVLSDNEIVRSGAFDVLVTR